MLFTDRHGAGRQLAARLLPLKQESPVVLALPRGGIPVGFEIARALHAPLDLVLVRKIGAPGEEELAIGAVAEGNPPELVTDQVLIERLGVAPENVEVGEANALREIERRRRVYLGRREPVGLAGRTAIVVDDGIGTGATMLAVLRATRRRGPARVVLAVPVAPPDTLRRMSTEMDSIVCLHTAEAFLGVGQFYRDFRQIQDAEVVALLDRAWAFASATERESA